MAGDPQTTHQDAWDRFYDRQGQGRPKVAPLRDERSSFTLGDYVYLDQPRDPDGFPVVHGVVLEVMANEDGEPLLRIAQHKVRYGRVEMYRKVIAAAEVDRTATSHTHPTQCSRAAAAILKWLGHCYEGGARWSHDDWLLIGSAQLLAQQNANTH